MALVERYQGGAIPTIATGTQVFKGQAVNMPVNAVGNALSGVSQQFGAMAEDYRRAKDAQHLLEAEEKMQQAQIDFSAWQATEQDETKWVPKWQEMTGALKKEFGKLPMSDNARLRLDSTFGARSSNQVLNLQGMAVKQAEQRATMAAQNTINRALESGDEQAANAALNALSESKLILPERLDASRFELEQAFKSKREQQARADADTFQKVGDYEAAKQSVMTLPPEERKNALTILNYRQELDDLEVLAAKDPRQAASLAVAKETAGKITGKDSLAIQAASEKTIQRFRADQMADVVKSVQNREPAEVIASKLDMADYMDDADKEKVMQFAKYGPVNDPASYADLWTQAKTFEGEEGSPEYSRLVSSIDMALDGEQKSSVMGQLSATVKGPKDGQTRAFNEVYSLVEEDRKNGVFGSSFGKLDNLNVALPANIQAEVDAIKAEVYPNQENFLGIDGQKKTSDEIEMEARKTWWTRKNPKPADGETFNNSTIEDLIGGRQSTTRSMAIIANLDRWRADNPKATPEEFRAYYESLVPAQRAASGYVSPLLPALEAPSIDLNDLLKRNAANLRK